MNNRILARIVAAVMAIAMLGTVSFAASISGDVIDINADADFKTQTQKTVVAYFASAADAEPAASDIIAMYQSNEAPEAIKIDTTKETALQGDNRKYLVVRYGGSDVEAQNFAIDLNGNATTVVPASTYTIDYVTWEKEISNVAYFTQEIGTLEAGKAIESYGFKLWKTGGENTSDQKPLYFTGDTMLEGDGSYSFGIVMVAVPSDVTLNAESFYTIK